MSKETHSQDSNSDPRNENDYDTWEYGTEPIPEDHTWRKKTHSHNLNDKIDPLTPNITEKCLDAYRRAAEYDDYMFGNLDYLDSWIGISTERSIDKEVE